MILGNIYGPSAFFYRSRNSSTFLTFKVKFTREPPNDFYLSGDRVQGIIQLATNDSTDDFYEKYGRLRVELIGELNDFLPHNHRRPNEAETRILFRGQALVKKLLDDDQQSGTDRFRCHKWVFDGLLDPTLPSSLPPDDYCDPCIFYYARVYLDRCDEMVRKFAFVFFNQTSISMASQKSLQHYNVEAHTEHRGVKLHGNLPNSGLAVPGQTLLLQIEIDNPMEVTIKSMRAVLKQYRRIVDEETDFTIFSFNLPGFQPQGFKNKFRQSTYELSIPLEKCRVMAPTSSLKNIRYELQIQCHIHALLKNHFTLILPVICTPDHQKKLEIMDELKVLTEKLPQPLLDRGEEISPPSYEDFIASEVLPKYEDIIR